MAIVGKPNTFVSGTVAVSSEVNSNFDTIYNDYNGNIDNTNISGSAAIADSKLAQIATSSKVNATALTALASTPSSAGYIPVANMATGTSGNFLMATSTTSSSVYVPAVVETAWANYTTASTIVGWASFSSQFIFIKKIGRTVFINFELAGVSTDTVATFTVPYACNTGISPTAALARVIDNSSGQANPGQINIATGTPTVVECFKDCQRTVFTNTGTKSVFGEFFYESA